jgi:hypothetical protein
LTETVANLMAFVRSRVTAVPADVVAERTNVFKLLNKAHAGRLRPVAIELTPGAVEATTLAPAGKASASMRTKAL